MPFAPVSDAKVIILWLLILEDQSSKPDPEIRLITGLEKTGLPKYRFGFNLIPIPGNIFWNIDFAFHAAWLYVIGSIVYIAYSYFAWELVNDHYSDDALNPAVYTNTLGSAIFILNAICCFFDWWTQRKQLSLSCIDIEKNINLIAGIELEQIPYHQSMLYFWNNVFFMGAAIVFFIQSIWYEDAETDIRECVDRYWCTFWINFWGNFLYFISSICSVLECSVNRRDRRNLGLPPLYLFTCEWDLIDWFSWGDVLFFAAGAMGILQTLLNTLVPSTNDDLTNGLLTCSVNVLFLIDSLAYFIGYLKFVADFRKALEVGYRNLGGRGLAYSLIKETFLLQDEEIGDANNPVKRTGSLDEVKCQFPQSGHRSRCPSAPTLGTPLMEH